MNDELANDRTFLAWLRTGIALFGLGFVIAKVALITHPTNQHVTNEGFYAAIGIVFVISGVGLVGVGYLQHKAVLDGLRTQPVRPRPQWPRVITIASIAGGLLLSVLIAVST